MALIKCPDCGNSVSDRAIKCPNCGCDLKKQIAATSNNLVRCPECGAPIEKDSISCPNCGVPIKTSSRMSNAQNYQSPYTRQPYNQQSAAYGQPQYHNQQFAPQPIQPPVTYYQQTESACQDTRTTDNTSLSKTMNIIAWVIWVVGIVICGLTNKNIGIIICVIALLTWIVATVTSNATPGSKALQIVGDVIWAISVYAFFFPSDNDVAIVLFVIALIFWFFSALLNRNN